MFNTKYMVEQYIGTKWGDAGWREDGNPWHFRSKKRAQNEINELCRELGYSKDEYRVVKAPKVVDPSVPKKPPLTKKQKTKRAKDKVAKQSRKKNRN